MKEKLTYYLVEGRSLNEVVAYTVKADSVTNGNFGIMFPDLSSFNRILCGQTIHPDIARRIREGEINLLNEPGYPIIQSRINQFITRIAHLGLSEYYLGIYAANFGEGLLKLTKNRLDGTNYPFLLFRLDSQTHSTP